MSQSSEIPEKAQLVIIGAGPGGYPAAFRAVELGRQVTLIDPEANPGGVCLQVGPAGVGTGHAAFAYLFNLWGSQRGADIFTLAVLRQCFLHLQLLKVNSMIVF